MFMNKCRDLDKQYYAEALLVTLQQVGMKSFCLFIISTYSISCCLSVFVCSVGQCGACLSVCFFIYTLACIHTSRCMYIVLD